MSNIKHGYPIKDYTEEDILTEEEAELLADVGLVTIDADHYEELVSKAAALELLEKHIRTTGSVNDDVVRAITGTFDACEMVSKEDADAYWGYYMDAKKNVEEQAKKIAQLKAANDELHKIIQQKHIGPYADHEEISTEEENG